MSLLAKFEQKQIEKFDQKHPDFSVGDTVKLMVKIVEGGNERVQAYQGVVIRIKNRAMGSTFTVKKESHGESIERTFLYYSPRLDKIEVIKRGKVRRSKLYYMRDRTGKSARIAEKVAKVVQKPAEEAKA